jgi:hypothetical protein
MLGHAPCTQAIERSPRCADLIEAHVRRAQPVAELLQAEESSEMALKMINKERERHEIEFLLPWQHGRARRRGPPIQASSISTSPRRGGTLNSYGNGHERCTFSPWSTTSLFRNAVGIPYWRWRM